MYWFIGRHDKTPPHFGEALKNMQFKDSVKVEILRPMLFIHEGQKDIRLGKLCEFFTEIAIKRFKVDGFIKIKI